MNQYLQSYCALSSIPNHDVVLNIHTDRMEITNLFYDTDSQVGLEDAGKYVPALKGTLVRVYETYVVSLEELRQRADWKGGSLFAVVVATNPDKIVTTGVINLFAESHPSLRPTRLLGVTSNVPNSVRFYLPFDNATFDDCIFYATPKPGRQVYSNKKFVEMNLEDMRHGIYEYFPKVTIAGDGSVKDAANLTLGVEHDYREEAEITVYLTVSAGYVSKHKVRLRQGRPELVQFLALGLQTGDVAEIKASFRYWTGVAKKTVTIG